ncbi:hypothetical protein K2Z83_23140 [Oscillochloris sp. ZM17-4]|uniref:hypothetical protein n=1 Tax=Oscillochloris sp. ZM17-4 TaxID=2866714 RepID=UPI001C739E42|nr:hypothetical protein [Oscillochloris sp. ZM17-4]MBX0330556.1 hypothetical protein [Oscillochloris sp. ZM17-4]
MSSNKSRLKGILAGGEPEPPAKPIQKGVPFQVSTVVTAAEPDFQGSIGELSVPLQDIARRYVGARRRSGEALLDAARWLTEARNTAVHGEWQIFLDATVTSADSAERLLNIHSMAMQNPQFADAVTRNWLGQSAAALLARPSTPPDVVADVLGQAAAPSVEDVRGAIARSRGSRRGKGAGQNPQIADFAPPQNPQFADFASRGAERQSETADTGEAAARLRADDAADLSAADLALEVLRETTRAIEGLWDLAPSLAGSQEGRSLIERMKLALHELEDRVL